jgi:hypothetical protein
MVERSIAIAENARALLSIGSRLRRDDDAISGDITIQGGGTFPFAGTRVD